MDSLLTEDRRLRGQCSRNRRNDKPGMPCGWELRAVRPSSHSSMGWWQAVWTEAGSTHTDCVIACSAFIGVQ